MQRRSLLSCALAATLATPMLTLAQGSNYPDRPITVVVPFASGGGSDTIARLITAKLTEKTGKSFIVDNRGGGGTNIGNELASRATPDGYTVLLGQFTLSVNPHLYAKLRYQPASFVPVVHIANAPTVVVVPASSPIHDLPTLIQTARAKPGKLNFGSGGAGTSVHLAGELFKQATHTDLLHVPYKGSAPAMTDLIGGQIDLMFDTSTSALGFVRGGKVRAIAVAADSRLKTLPQVPTTAEQGLKDFEVLAWYGLLAPAGTPDAQVQWLNRQVNAVLKDPALITQLDAAGAVPVGGPPQQLASFMKSQSARWERVIKESHIQLD